jgi:hypothetical protein
MVTCKSPAVHARDCGQVPDHEDCGMEPQIYTSAAYPNIMPGIYADYGGSGYDVHVPAVTVPVTPNWREVVITYAKGRKYEGFHPTKYPRGNERRFMSYQEDVTMTVFLCQGPRATQAQVDFVASFCAVALCEGRAKEIVQGLVEKEGKLPLKRDLYCQLQDDIASHPVQFWIAAYESDVSLVGDKANIPSWPPVEEMGSGF